MIHLLAECLRQAGIDFTIRELDDILWLASTLTHAAQDAAADPPAAGSSTAEKTSGAGVEPYESVVNGEQGTTTIANPDTAPGAAMFAHAGMDGRISAGVLRVPGVAGSPGPGDLRRALQPFARRVDSRLQRELDEEATANSAAESRLWLPVFRSLRERRVELSLVIEDCTSATIRARALSDFVTHLRQQGGLRRVDVYRLTGSGDMRLTTESGIAVDPTRLARGDGHHLALFATDGTSLRWRNGVAPAFLHAVGARTSISILHLLPRDAWPNTLVGSPDLLVHAGYPCEANRHMGFDMLHWIDPDEVAGHLPVPVLGMDTEEMARWARTVSARGGSIPGVLLAPAVLAQTNASVRISAADPSPVPNPEPAERVARFRQMASPAAFDLAVFLSPMDALTIPIIRLVQRTMSPNGGDGELAEFILGGLVVPTRRPGDDGEQVYRFRKGVAAELFRSLRYSEEHMIRRQLRLVGQFLEDEADQEAAFAGMFPSPDGQATLAEWALPFAEVSRDALRRFASPDVPIPSPQEHPEHNPEPVSVQESAAAEAPLLAARRAEAQDEKLTLDDDDDVIDQSDKGKAGRGTSAFSEADETPLGVMALRPHQERIASLALKAVDTVDRRRVRQRRHAGIIAQSFGTGMTMSLIRYLTLSADTRKGRRRCHLIVVDRLDQAYQIVDGYRQFMRSAEPQIKMPSTPAQLCEDLAVDHTTVTVTTVQKLNQIEFKLDANSVVVLFDLRSVTSALIERFQGAITLIFSHEAALADPRFESTYGPVIASYVSGSAVEEGYLLPVDILQERMAVPSNLVQANDVRYVASTIAKESGARHAKAVLVAPNTAAAERFHNTIQRDGLIRSVLAVRARSPVLFRQTVVRFNRLVGEPAVLVTTAATAMGLYLNGVDICYVTATVSTKAMFKLESFVNQKRPDKERGTIVDMALNDWTALDRSRLLTWVSPR